MIIGIDSSRAFIRDKTGTENYSYHLIKALLRVPESRLHTFVLFIRPNAVLPKELARYSNVIVREIKWRYLWTQVGLAWETWKRQTLPECLPAQAGGSPSLRECRGLDVLWIPAHTLPLLRRGFGGLGGALRTVVTIHGLEYQWLREYKNWLQRWYLPLSTIYATKAADCLIAVSDFTKNQLVKELHTDSKKIKVIYEGTESHSRSACLRRQVGALHSGSVWGKYVLFVGTVQPRKNLVALIQAFSKTDLDKLVIAGGIGWEAEEILRAPARFGVQEKVVFTGRVTELELRGLYLGASLYVQPSLTEGFGLPILEAMAAGVPVVSSDGGALPEVVKEAGLIVRLGNSKFEILNPKQIRNSKIQTEFVDRLARAMERVINDQKLRKRLISMGYKRAKEFSWDKAAKASLAVLVGEGV